MDKQTFNFMLLKIINAEKQFGTKIYIFEHKLTGLRVYYCYPNDYQFNLKVSFYTPQINNKGTTHILEHMLCHTKSRSKNKWYMPSYTNSKTFFNAATFDDHTAFEVTSKSITDFRIVAKAMLNSIFRDEFDFTDEEIAFETAYIKDFNSVDGVIYNELRRGLEDSENLADEYASEFLYKDSHFQYAPGGKITDILSITREELEEYYFKYYKLANCKIFASGGFDLISFLEYLDKNICAGKTIEKVERLERKKTKICENKRVPFYASVGYPKDENIYVWGIKLPPIDCFEERIIYELAMKIMFDGGDEPFDQIIGKGLAKRYKKTILIDRSEAPYLRITFHNVPEGKEEDIDRFLNTYIMKIKYMGVDTNKYGDAMRSILKDYGIKKYDWYDPEDFDRIYFLFMDDTFLDLDFGKLYEMLNNIDYEGLTDVCVALASQANQFKFVMYPSVDYVFDIESDFLLRQDDFKSYSPVIEDYGKVLADNLRLNCTKKEVTRKLSSLRKAIDEIKYEKINVDGVNIYKFDSETRFVNFTFDLRKLSDYEICFLPVLLDLINKRLKWDKTVPDAIVDADVIQNNICEEYFRLEIKCHFRTDEINVDSLSHIYNLIENITPSDIINSLLTHLVNLRGRSSDKLSRDLAIRTDSNGIPYRGVVHRKSFFDRLFDAGSQNPNKTLSVCNDFIDVCYKILRRCNLTIMTTSGVLDKKEAACDPKKLVNVFSNLCFDNTERCDDYFNFDKELTFHYANMKSSATGVIKVEGFKELNLGKKMVCDRVLYNFMYILFRQLGLSYQVDGTFAANFATVTSHSIRCCDDYRSCFAACGIYFENFSGNLNHYKSNACDLLLDMFVGVINPKINVFRYMESGVSFEEILSIPEAIESMTNEDLMDIGTAIIKASSDAKVYAVCGPGSYPFTMDDYTFNSDYAFPDFLI